jgi:hypothetical protein
LLNSSSERVLNDAPEIEDDNDEPTPIMLRDIASERAPLLGYTLPSSNETDTSFSALGIVGTLKLVSYSMPAVILGLMLTLLV